MCALRNDQFKRVGRVKAISPLLMSKACIAALGQLPRHVNHKVNNTCVDMLAKLGAGLSDQDKQRVLSQTIRQIGEAIYK